MDLSERSANFTARHPWEVARASAIRLLLDRIPVGETNCHVLDVGCGDGFISREIFKTMRVRSLTGIDTNLSHEEISGCDELNTDVTYVNDYSRLKDKHYQLILLLDVIEHVEDDGSFVRDMANRYVADGGHIVITAPAFPRLFGSHDRFLNHYRRYSRRELVDLASGAGLDCLASGYFFVSLLPVRFLQKFRENILRSDAKDQAGVGAWNHRRLVTKAVELVLKGDARVSLCLSRAGITLPGLTVWAICRKPRS